MLQSIGTTCGMAIAGMCLVSTLAMAQPTAPGQTMTCTKIDAQGYGIEAKAHVDRMITVRVEGVKVSEKMKCVTTDGNMTCTKITTTGQ